MKLIPTPRPSFTPVNITLVFESQSELDGFGSLMNTNNVSEAMNDLHELDLDPIAEGIASAGGNIHLTRPIYDKLTGNEDVKKGA